MYGSVHKVLVLSAGKNFHMLFATMETISVEHRAKLFLSEYAGMMMADSMPTINAFLRIPPFQMLLTNRACVLCLYVLHGDPSFWIPPRSGGGGKNASGVEPEDPLRGGFLAESL